MNKQAFQLRVMCLVAAVIPAFFTWHLQARLVLGVMVTKRQTAPAVGELPGASCPRCMELRVGNQESRGDVAAGMIEVSTAASSFCQARRGGLAVKDMELSLMMPYWIPQAFSNAVVEGDQL